MPPADGRPCPVARRDIQSLQFLGETNLRIGLKRLRSQFGSMSLQSSNAGGLDLTTERELGLIPHESALWPAAEKFVASLSKIAPIVPVLPTLPTRKCCAVYNLQFASFHGMEEVIAQSQSMAPRRGRHAGNRSDISPNRDH
jgi:hypothetical protein